MNAYISESSRNAQGYRVRFRGGDFSMVCDELRFMPHVRWQPKEFKGKGAWLIGHAVAEQVFALFTNGHEQRQKADKFWQACHPDRFETNIGSVLKNALGFDFARVLTMSYNLKHGSSSNSSISEHAHSESYLWLRSTLSSEPRRPHSQWA